jgi:hypothetical protein
MSAQDHSFDIVSNVDLQEVDNAVNITTKEISQRFDFKGSKSKLTFDRKEKSITIIADDTYKLKSVIDILQSKIFKRGISQKALQYEKIESAFDGTVRQVVKIQQGIPTEKAKEIVKLIKQTKLKVQAQIQEDQVRVSAKKIDDLQEIQKMLKEKEFDFAMQFVNYR